MNNQIEEMARIIAKNVYGAEQNVEYAPNARNASKELFSKGYRIQDEVAREIFVAMEREIKDALEQNYTVRQERIEKCGMDEFVQICSAKIHTLQGILDFIEKFKKKYEVQDE